ncbi:tyrosine-type recombinase/integrase [Variovorax sp. AB1(2024)]|uniref:tyrosine-type recombinase/integrase n=1 Tax=Variovorax sp. AB1(2024) TaxID=3132214 RepID=UPI0030B42F93
MIRKPKNSSNFHYRFNYKGKTYSGSTGTSSRHLATQYESKVRDDVFKKVALGEVEEPDRITLSKAIALYLHDNRHTTIPTTYTTCSTKLFGRKRCNRTHKMVRIYGLRDESIETYKDKDIQKLINERRNEGNKNTTILYELVFLSVVFKHVKRLGYQVPDIDFDELKKANKLNANRGRLRFLSMAEEKMLLIELSRTLEADNDFTKLCRVNALHFAVMLLDIGCRMGELQKLKWSDIDMEKRQIQLYRSKVDNESALAMTHRVYEVLADRLASKAADQTLVFEGMTSRTKNKQASLLKCRAAFNSACERAGIKGCSFHTLRHTHASRLVQAGVSLYVVQHQLGHSSPTTTTRYAHLAPQQATLQAANVLNQIQEAA